MRKLTELKELEKKELTKALKEEEHIKEWKESAQSRTQSADFKSLWNNQLSGMRKYVKFLCSNPANLVLKFEDLVKEARNHPTAKPAQMKIDMFYKWLLKMDAGDYVLNDDKKIGEGSAAQCAYSKIRAFYSHNGVIFPKSFRAPRSISETRVALTDRALKIIIYDENGLPYVDNDNIFQPFFKRLRFRDQVIVACQLGGGGHDLIDLLKITCGQVKDSNHYSHDGRNFQWSGNRQKTGERFRVPFTSSATKMLKDYVNQERTNAESNELVFLKKEDENGNILGPSAVANNYKTALYNALNITNGKNEYNPLRPKRFRHIFTTITTKRAQGLDISPNMIRLWQGHSATIQDGYVEQDWESIVRDYRKIEPFFQVFEVVITDTDRDVEKLRTENVELRDNVAKLETQFDRLESTLQNVLTNWVDSDVLRRAFASESEEE